MSESAAPADAPPPRHSASKSKAVNFKASSRVTDYLTKKTSSTARIDIDEATTASLAAADHRVELDGRSADIVLTYPIETEVRLVPSVNDPGVFASGEAAADAEGPVSPKKPSRQVSDVI